MKEAQADMASRGTMTAILWAGRCRRREISRVDPDGTWCPAISPSAGRGKFSKCCATARTRPTARGSNATTSTGCCAGFTERLPGHARHTMTRGFAAPFV
jgi:hypothetical protein